MVVSAVVLRADAPQFHGRALSLCICCGCADGEGPSPFLTPEMTWYLLQRSSGPVPVSGLRRGAAVHLAGEEVRDLRLHLGNSCMPLLGFGSSRLMFLVAGAEISRPPKLLKAQALL